MKPTKKERILQQSSDLREQVKESLETIKEMKSCIARLEERLTDRDTQLRLTSEALRQRSEEVQHAMALAARADSELGLLRGAYVAACSARDELKRQLVTTTETPSGPPCVGQDLVAVTNTTAEAQIEQPATTTEVIS